MNETMRLIFHIYRSDDHKEELEGIRDNFKKVIIRKNTHGFELDIHTEEVEKSIEAIRSLFYVWMISFPNLIEQSFKFRKPLNENETLEILRFSESLMLQERFWESHVILEELWKCSEGKVKTYYQGLILISASMVHYKMGRKDKAYEMYMRGRQFIKLFRLVNDILDTIPMEFDYPIALNFKLMFPNKAD